MLGYIMLGLTLVLWGFSLYFLWAALKDKQSYMLQTGIALLVFALFGTGATILIFRGALDQFLGIKVG